MTDSWETGSDAASSAQPPAGRIEARVVLTFGELAEVATAHHPSNDPLRVSAADLAEQLGVSVQALPGCRFTALVEGEAVREARLS